jgi:hypothetical protein
VTLIRFLKLLAVYEGCIPRDAGGFGLASGPPRACL